MGTADSHVNDEAHVDPDIAAIGAVAVRRGPIGDIAANARRRRHQLRRRQRFVRSTPTRSPSRTRIGVPGEPFAVVVSDDRAYVSTSSASYDAVSVIDTNTKTVIATYPLAFGVTALAISPDGKRVYAGRTGNDHVDVAVIDTTAERVGTIDIATGAGIGVDAIAVDPTGKRLYVATTDARGSQLVVVNAETARVDRKVWVGSPIRDLAFADGTAYVLTSRSVSAAAPSASSTCRPTGSPTPIELGDRRPHPDDAEPRQDPRVRRRLRPRRGAVHAEPRGRQHRHGRRPAVLRRSGFRRRPALCRRLRRRRQRVLRRLDACRCCTRTSWRPTRSRCAGFASWSRRRLSARCSGSWGGPPCRSRCAG